MKDFNDSHEDINSVKNFINFHENVNSVKNLISSHENVNFVKNFINFHENIISVENFINSHENIISVEDFISFHQYDNSANEMKIDNHEFFAYSIDADELCISNEIVLISRKSQTVTLSRYLKNLDTDSEEDVFSEENVFSEKDVSEFRFSASTDFVSEEQLANNIRSRSSSTTSSYEVIMQQDDKNIISSAFHIALKL